MERRDPSKHLTLRECGRPSVVWSSLLCWRRCELCQQDWRGACGWSVPVPYALPMFSDETMPLPFPPRAQESRYAKAILCPACAPVYKDCLTFRAAYYTAGHDARKAILMAYRKPQ